MVNYLMDYTTGHILANNNFVPLGRVISAISMEELFHMKVFRVAKSQVGVNDSVLGILEKALEYVRGQRKGKGGTHQRRFSMPDQELEMIAVICKIAAALSKSAGHTVEVYKAEESTPHFRVFVTTTEEGDHAVVMVHGSKVTVIPLFKESPEKLT
jgi:hypothetical protein